MAATLLPNYTDIAIIGAGPHAMTVVTHLLQKRQQLRQRLLVFDPSGTWMQQWQNQFSAFEIPHLRSPAVHHPDPNPYALRQFAQSRSHELYPPYDLPGTLLFQDFCQELIRRWSLQQHIVTAKVVHIEPIKQNLRSRFRLWLDNLDHSIVARRVILATGSGTPQIPAWVQKIASPYPQDRLCHSRHVDLRHLQLHGENILIVGGGLTSGHLALGAIARGAKVILMSRRNLQEKLFDADPGWLGPKYLKNFWAEPDWETRAETIQNARNGGSLTPAIMLQLRRAQRQQSIKIMEKCQVLSATWHKAWQIICDDGSKHECDRIWLATGTKIDITSEPLLTEIIEHYPISTAKGLPVLDPHLRWAGCELFITGGLAALQIGPVARNLSGARMASERIIPALWKPSLAFSY
jgi:cation diffusion facilitator CzcD-associated flavoprotein CzcO